MFPAAECGILIQIMSRRSGGRRVVSSLKIGLVGAAATIETIHALMDEEEVFVELVDYPCHRENVVELLAEIQSGLDGVLFTGEAIFVHAGRYASAIVPWTYLKRSVNSVLCVLLRAAMDGHDIRRITYDLPYFTSKEMLGLLCDRVGLDKSEVMVNCYGEYKDSAPDAGKTAAHPQTPQHWHLENFRAGRASVCLSSVETTVSHPLLKDYPAFQVKITGEDVVEALNTLRFRSQLQTRQLADRHMEAVLSITIYMQDNYTQGIREYRQLQSTYHVEKAILRFAQGIGASVEKDSGGCYLLYAARSELELRTENMTKLDFAADLLSVMDVQRVAVGVGFGLTHSIARANALQAAKAARLQSYSCCYTADGDARLEGPLLISGSCSGEERDKLIIERIAAETYVGVSVLNTIIKAQKQYGFDVITSGELAEMCRLSANQMNRILTRLEAGGYAKIVGSQAHSSTGRPRRLIRLDFGI